MNYKEQEFLEYTIKSLVSNPEKVKLSRIVDEMGVLYVLSVAQEDISKVIGRNGQIAKAIRLLLRAVGYKQKVRANLKIDAPQIGINTNSTSA